MLEMSFGIVIFFLLGTVVGSFINATEYRLAQSKRVFWDKGKGFTRSACTHCDTTISATDLIPLLSFLFLRGRCRSCRKKISWQYPLVELVSGLLFVCAAVRFGYGLEALAIAFFFGILLFIFLYDYKHQLILDVVSVPAMIFAGAVGVLLGKELLDLVIGAAIGGVFFWLQYAVSRGKWIGGGDIRLGILMGLMLGWKVTIAALVLAYVGGALVAVALLLQKKAQMQSRIPFGTFLSAATFICLLFGEEIIDWYFQLLI